PALASSGWPSSGLLDDGPFGLAMLRPQQLFGLHFDPLTHGVFWSLLVNVICYVLFSLSRPLRMIERVQASAFVDFDGGQSHFGSRSWDGSVGVADLAALAAQYLGADRARRAFDEFA